MWQTILRFTNQIQSESDIVKPNQLYFITFLSECQEIFYRKGGTMASYVKRGDSYDIRCYCGTDVNGKRINKYLTWTPEPGLTPKQVEKELRLKIAEFELLCSKGLVFDSNMTFANYVDTIWMKKAESEIKPTTFRRYILLLKRILPAIGHLKIGQIQPYHLRSFFDDLREERRDDSKYTPNSEAHRLSKTETRPELAKHTGLSTTTVDCIRAGKNVSKETASKFAKYFDTPVSKLFDVEDVPLSSRTILHHYRLISSIMHSAVYDNIIPSNPCQRIKPPKVEATEAHYLDDEQAELLLRTVIAKAEHPFDIIVILLLHTGMRRGECCGLEWDDVDFENCTIDINKSLLYLPEKGVFENDTKTYSSRRVIKVGSDLIEMLREFRAWQDKEAVKLGDKWVDSGKIFTAWNGKAINPGTVTKWFHSFVQDNNLPYVSIHGLRHTNASIMISSGVPITTTAKRLGHSTSATTSRVYAHAIASVDAMTADVIQSILPLKTSKT